MTRAKFWVGYELIGYIHHDGSPESLPKVTEAKTEAEFRKAVAEIDELSKYPEAQGVQPPYETNYHYEFGEGGLSISVNRYLMITGVKIPLALQRHIIDEQK